MTLFVRVSALLGGLAHGFGCLVFSFALSLTCFDYCPSNIAQSVQHYLWPPTHIAALLVELGFVLAVVAWVVRLTQFDWRTQPRTGVIVLVVPLMAIIGMALLWFSATQGQPFPTTEDQVAALGQRALLFLLLGAGWPLVVFTSTFWHKQASPSAA